MDKRKSLPPLILAVCADKGTERPFTGAYTDSQASGTYLCRQCGLALFRSNSKFHSGCGWPSFDNALADAITSLVDADGRRTEILCKRCSAHLGHVFEGEGFTPLNTRHCVNSLSLDFVADGEVCDSQEAIFAAGCFWGVEHFFKQCQGVLKTEVGYIGGALEEPSYEAVCTKTTGHVEAVRVVFDPQKTDFKTLAKYFFEIHDPTQHNGQGPDIGEQYLSGIFVFDEEQRKIAQQLIKALTQKGYAIATFIRDMTPFWPAEDYHQDYYHKTQKQPYCHRYTKRFDD